MKSISSNKSPLRDEIISFSLPQDNQDPSRASVSGVWTFNDFHSQSGSRSFAPSHSHLSSSEIEEAPRSVSQASGPNELVSFVGEHAMRDKYVAYECEEVQQEEGTSFFQRLSLFKKEFLENWETYTSKTCLLMM
ncbi:hypothetical protein GUITHDRAFT_144370 [Guillardia theta CCMP2712]|uniref:Uncharacterized protein n=1 Tax=Guillardia theta (strain CCMP2712) TaxID=905079 RepID=L1IQC1_GUITC|nr:hypothetical protein GUITHDRAFT_144370 [Guillardia theta CCMP2712]EKX38262.1 hypothetical protein GUITHDRAFT_144370 [Guillardia theta CCMP2712]|eukprot:XP_005825242.1 hypothetical protein GUITHDRAFT_144370 [Guillardia theta CCMP2712]